MRQQNWPRVWFIWRGNAILSSAKGHEFFLRHYLGTHDKSVADEAGKGKVKTVTWREPAPRGKMDLVVDINFRMDTSALYSDIVLPAASWYEKNDLNTTDLHSFVHPLSAAVPPVWETKSDWDIFKALAQKVSELAPSVFPEPVRDVVMRPLMHDTPDELAQTEVLDWRPGEDGMPSASRCPARRCRTSRSSSATTRSSTTSSSRSARFCASRGSGRTASTSRSPASTTSCSRTRSATLPTRARSAAWSGAASGTPHSRTPTTLRT